MLRRDFSPYYDARTRFLKWLFRLIFPFLFPSIMFANATPVWYYNLVMSRKTRDLDNAHYSPELIRKYENPEYARRAEEYERQARAEKGGRHGRQRTSRRAESQRNYSYDEGYYDSRNSQGDPARYQEQGYSYEDYLAARGESRQGKHGASRRAGRGSRKQPKAPRQRKRHRFHLGRLIRNLIILALILAVALFAYILSLTKNLDRVDTSGKNFAINDQVASDLKGYRNIAILGSDARRGESYTGSRTDAIIILSIKRTTGETHMISVMRDSYLKIRDGSGNLMLDKVTHAHAYGGGVDTISSLNRNLDLNIREYVVFNWQAVADTVDTLGGIEVDVKRNEIADLNKWGPETGRNVGSKYHKITHTGVQTLDGVQATTYCRIRKTSGGDTGRAQRYKKIMSAVMKKAASSPTKLSTLSKEVMPEIRTNMTQTQLATLMLRAPMMDMQKSISWPKSYYGGIVNGVWYAIPTTLNTNVKRLHRQAFGQTDYVPTATCRAISDEIVSQTGIAYGNN